MAVLPGSRFFRLIVVTVAVSTFVSVCFYFARADQGLSNSLRFQGAGFPSMAEWTTEKVPSVVPPRKGTPANLAKAPEYVNAIFNPDDRKFQKLECPLSSEVAERYRHLQVPKSTSLSSSHKRRYFFALDLYEIAFVLPQLMGTLIEAINFLGPHNCVLSIVEGRSTDGTYEILRALQAPLQDLGVAFFLQVSDLSPNRVTPERIQLLAELRNLALRDLYENPDAYAPDTAIIFSNDVFLCADDVLELVHQHVFQRAHLTCGMDWHNTSNPLKPRYYDLWIGRSLTGDTFYKDEWAFREGFFQDHELSRTRWADFLPVQVFSCWNGIIALTAAPFMSGDLRFRGVPGGVREKKDKECFQGEPNLLTKDLWWLGYNRIQTLPTITATYDYYDAKAARNARGSIQSHTNGIVPRAGEKIDWVTEPPKQFHCIPKTRDPEWVPWDQNLKALYGDRRPLVEA